MDWQLNLISALVTEEGIPPHLSAVRKGIQDTLRDGGGQEVAGIVT